MEQITQLLPTCKQPIGLYIVSTPIGNMMDITLRALSVLKNSDILVCEDTRVTAQLLKHFDIHTPMLCYNDFSTPTDREAIVNMLREGKSVALLSDAGTPLVSDPGYKLAQEVTKQGYMLYTIPGPCAAISALTLSGLPSDQFYFAGFLPPKTSARRHHLAELAAVRCTFIFYESPRRLTDTLKDILTVLGDQPCVIARELTKRYEEVKRGTVSQLIAWYEQHPPKGECIILYGNHTYTAPSEEKLDHLLRDALRTLSAKDAASTVAELTGLPRKHVYQRILTLSSKHAG